MPHTNFNTSQLIFQIVPGNTRITLSVELFKNQRKYIIPHFGEHQIHFYPIAIERQGTSGQNSLNAELLIPGVCSERVYKNKKFRIIKLN